MAEDTGSFASVHRKYRGVFKTPSQSEMLTVYEYACTLMLKYAYMLMHVRINSNCKNLGLQTYMKFICINSLKL